ncbi:PIR Superfamily Protein [Plasmodium ovale curtisi]|uniref:PIR Superfamily Protein n=1 Tax=Plasmodium ovale curtisi TaxID=864141 RepID=A0A1A8WHV6_PLAOA|nr:PIR Superfamily Protein [Plasmodium ovale curtisi]SBT01985.1 PIR Superfamily Protein [Plasmodium ovale curtisi]
MTNSKLKHQYYEIFYKVRKQFSNQNDADYTDVFNTNDQFLRNIALYLAENYNDAYAYCSTGKDCAEYCNYLNKWLNEKKSIYTSNGTCKLNDTLWKQYIEKLWNEIGNTKEKKDWCARKDDVINLPFPKDRHSSSCENTEYVNFSHTCDSAKDVQAIATGPPCTCPFQISTASSTFGYVLFAFLAIGIFLLNCSPLKIWLNTLVGKKKIMRDYMNESENEEIDTNTTRDRNTFEDRRMRMIYHSMEN